MNKRVNIRAATFCLALFVATLVLHGQVQTLSDSTRPVASPDGKKVVVVERIFRVVDGEPERYPSRLLVRISDAGATTTRQRRIDASQVRLLNPPRWLDNRWAAFTYNISKNANGVVYVDGETGEALQMEFVALRRRMAASDVIEVELTSFEVTEYTTQVLRITNITRRNRSVFPLFLRPLPPYDTTPFPWVFAEQVRAAVQAYHAFLEKKNIKSLRLEEASESFAPEDKRLAALACVNGQPTAFISPMEAESPAAALERVVFFPLEPDITLTCLADVGPTSKDVPTTSSISEESEPLGHFGEFRFRTSWKDENTALVEQELFESEEQEPHREPLYALHVDGKMEKLAAPKKVDPSTSSTIESDAATTDSSVAAPSSAVQETAAAISETTATADRTETTSSAALQTRASTNKATKTITPQRATQKRSSSNTQATRTTKKSQPSPTPRTKSSGRRSSR
jgi:hypothetical protein